MPTPWCIELNYPYILWAQDHGVKVWLVKNYNFILARWSAFASTTWALVSSLPGAWARTSALFSAQPPAHLLLNLLHRILNYTVCISCALISFGGLLLIQTKVLKSWEPFNVVWGPNWPLVIHINSTNINHSFQNFGSFFPWWLQCLAMSAPWSIKFYQPWLVRVQYLAFEICFCKANDSGWGWVIHCKSMLLNQSNNIKYLRYFDHSFLRHIFQNKNKFLIIN